MITKQKITFVVHYGKYKVNVHANFTLLVLPVSFPYFPLKLWLLCIIYDIGYRVAGNTSRFCQNGSIR